MFSHIYPPVWKEMSRFYLEVKAFFMFFCWSVWHWNSPLVIILNETTLTFLMLWFTGMFVFLKKVFQHTSLLKRNNNKKTILQNKWSNRRQRAGGALRNHTRETTHTQGISPTNLFIHFLQRGNLTLGLIHLCHVFEMLAATPHPWLRLDK